VTALAHTGRAAGSRLRGWLLTRHSLRREAILVLGFYALYEGTRGLASGDSGLAERHAHHVIDLERWLHCFVERDVQQAVHAVPHLAGTLGVLYLTLHLTVTGGYLLWLHLRRPAAFPIVRSTLLIASGLALIGYIAYPTAPPRLAGVGITDTVSNGHVDLNHGLISSLYNPYAAVPSMHVGYAVIVGAGLYAYGGRMALRVAGILYPCLVLLTVVATGNHFLFDATVGTAVSATAYATVRLLGPRQLAEVLSLPASREATELPTRRAA
jgi:hypothetical protein